MDGNLFSASLAQWNFAEAFKHTLQGESILCPAHHLQRTFNEPFTSRPVAHQNSLVRYSPHAPTLYWRIFYL